MRPYFEAQGYTKNRDMHVQTFFEKIIFLESNKREKGRIFLSVSKKLQDKPGPNIERAVLHIVTVLLSGNRRKP